MMAEPKDFDSKNQYTWCPGCGNFMIHMVLKKLLAENGYETKNVLSCFDIGCCGNASDKINTYSFHGLHGRVLPIAAGASLANRKMKVIAFGGDGGTLGEGINHLIHSIRSNYNFMFIMHNNSNFGLTTGQASPSTKKDVPMNSSPLGIPEDTINAMRVVLSMKPSFAARTYSGDIPHMTKIFSEAMKHKGFAFVEVLQYCPTYYHDIASPQWFKDHLYDLDTVKHDPSNIEKARELAEDITDKIGIGVFYKDSSRKPFYDRLKNRVGMKTELVDEVKRFDISELIKEFV
jgi:2-oxoglutarate ferredoxin oxidoreductase subunit beta